ncbi:hypothetical protein CICLE_v10034007mg [Citrus x clementina]|uniref:Uncharacterized protein n=1 Tax=Citrus clementina TaxID=85681 RepID=V4SP14_CITCL|nr:hypothetical protein CICLE_v10034007mg [Citrus x clementina]
MHLAYYNWLFPTAATTDLIRRQNLTQRQGANHHCPWQRVRLFLSATPPPLQKPTQRSAQARQSADATCLDKSSAPYPYWLHVYTTLQRRRDRKRRRLPLGAH